MTEENDKVSPNPITHDVAESGTPQEIKSAQVNQPEKTADHGHPDAPDLKKILLAKVFGRFYRPIIDWAEKLSWKQALILLVLFSLATTFLSVVWTNPGAVSDFFLLSSYYWDAGHSQFRAKVLQPTNTLVQYVRSESAAPRRSSADGRHDSWTEAQVRVALDGVTNTDDTDLLRWFERQSLGRTCWRQHPKSDVDHIGATAWVLLALSRIARKLNTPEIKLEIQSHIECLLATSNLHVTGWWSQYPSEEIEQNASTYATALSVWALHELSNGDLVPKSQKARVEAAVAAGKDWLLNHSIPGEPATWKDYERGLYGKESFGISGLVIHVLHSLGFSSTSIDQAWMAGLPNDIPVVDDQVASACPIRLASGGVASDPTHNFTVPWLLIATVDAYPQGTFMQRARAQRLFSRIGEKTGEIQRRVQGFPWLAAELLMSLRYLQGEKVI